MQICDSFSSLNFLISDETLPHIAGNKKINPASFLC